MKTYIIHDPSCCPCHCRACGKKTILLQRGGCGGNGKIVGCENCQAVFQQTTGGMFEKGIEKSWEELPLKLYEWKKAHPKQTQKS